MIAQGDIPIDLEDQLLQKLTQLQLRIESIERSLHLQSLNDRQWLSTDLVAKLVNRRPFTVREWCRKGRLLARKRQTGRGNKPEWEIEASEVERFRNHGLRPTGEP